MSSQDGYRPVAQLVEQHPNMVKVGGSSPSGSTEVNIMRTIELNDRKVLLDGISTNIGWSIGSEETCKAGIDISPEVSASVVDEVHRNFSLSDTEKESLSAMLIEVLK